jgi:hypothetical protein
VTKMKRPKLNFILATILSPTLFLVVIESNSYRMGFAWKVRGSGQRGLCVPPFTEGRGMCETICNLRAEADTSGLKIDSKKAKELRINSKDCYRYKCK